MRTVFKYEWKKLLRQPVQLMSLLFFSLLSLYSMWEGKTIIDEQQEVVFGIKESYNKDFKEVLGKFEITDTTAVETKDAEYAKMPVMISYWLPQNAINNPSSLAFLSIGERDILPFYEKIKTTVDYLDSSNIGLDNPLVLWAGNFDFSFVLIYLLPILIIIFSYDVLSSERERGIHKIIAVQGMGTTSITLYKLFFRIILLGALVLALLGIAFLMAGNVEFTPVWLWILGALSYLLFWFACCFCVTSWQWGSLPNLIVLFSVWLFFVILLPSCTSIYINAKQPIPLRTSVASFQRETSKDIWASDKKKIVDTFLLRNPNYVKFYDIEKEKNTTGWGAFQIAAYYDLLQRRVEEHVAPYEELLEKRRQTASRLNQWNPVIRIQKLNNTLAQTSLKDYQEFKKNVNIFQQEWRDFIYSFELPEKDFSQEDLSKFPVFEQGHDLPNSSGSMHGLSVFWGWIAIFLLGGLVGNKTQNLKI